MIPIATDTSVHRTPWANYGLIAVNVIIFMLAPRLGERHPYYATSVVEQFLQKGILDRESPQLYQVFTYQFLHGNTMHLVGNMLFLWVFGNAVNAKMGHIPYLLFYLAGGVAAATGFMWANEGALLGASGSIAAVTTAYLALFPRSRVTILYFWIIIGTFELPSMLLIIFKMILWDNVIAPSLQGGQSNVAFDAHLAGYAFGFIATCLMLALRILPRDQFDIIALVRRALQRQQMRSIMSTPQAQAQAQFGRVARPVSFDEISVKMADTAHGTDVASPAAQARTEINEALERGDRETATASYEKLLELDPRCVLGRNQQMDIAHQFYTSGRFPQAVAAYEKFLSTYPSAAEANHVKLLLGIIYARDLHQYEVAEQHLRESLDRVTDDRRREQCLHWLKVANDALNKPTN